MNKLILLAIAIAFPAIAGTVLFSKQSELGSPTRFPAAVVSNDMAATFVAPLKTEIAPMQLEQNSDQIQEISILQKKSDELAKETNERKLNFEQSRTQFRLARKNYQSALKQWNETTIAIENLKQNLEKQEKSENVPMKQKIAELNINSNVNDNKTEKNWNSEIGILGQVTSRPMELSEMQNPQALLKNIQAKRTKANEPMEVFVTGMKSTTHELKQLRLLAKEQNITVLRLPKIKGNRLLVRMATAQSNSAKNRE